MHKCMHGWMDGRDLDVFAHLLSRDLVSQPASVACCTLSVYLRVTPPSYVPVTLRGATSQKSHLRSSVLIKSTPSSTVQKLELKITEARGSYVIRQCIRLSETQHFQGCIKAAGDGRNQGGKPKLHKAAKE